MVVVVALMSMTTHSAREIRTIEMGSVSDLGSGESRAMIQVEAEGDLAVLHVLVVASPDDAEMITTRVRLHDGQQFAMSVAPDDASDRANRFVFKRQGDRILAKGLSWEEGQGGPSVHSASFGGLW